jgi:superfamily I DNA and/or RNA helicase
MPFGINILSVSGTNAGVWCTNFFKNEAKKSFEISKSLEKWDKTNPSKAKVADVMRGHRQPVIFIIKDNIINYISG